MPRGKFDSTNEKHYPDLGSDASSVWNFLCSFLRRHLAGEPVIASPNVGCFLGLFSLVYICCLLHIYAYSSECYLQRHCNRSQTLGLRSVHLTNSHLRICDLESYETTNLETQNYAESACENHGEIVKQLIGSEKKPK